MYRVFPFIRRDLYFCCPLNPVHKTLYQYVLYYRASGYEMENPWMCVIYLLLYKNSRDIIYKIIVYEKLN